MIFISTMSIILMAVSCKNNVTQELKVAYAKFDEIEAKVDSVAQELEIVSAKIDELEAKNALLQEQPNNAEKELEENYIMIPGITYISTQSEKDTDIMGGEVNLTMEFTIYNDGSVVGNLIETNSSKSYSNGNSYNHYVEGKWSEVSIHDKRFLEICLVLEDSAQDYYKEFTYYVDEDLKIYDRPSSTTSMQLKKK